VYAELTMVTNHVARVPPSLLSAAKMIKWKCRATQQ